MVVLLVIIAVTTQGCFISNHFSFQLCDINSVICRSCTEYIASGSIFRTVCYSLALICIACRRRGSFACTMRPNGALQSSWWRQKDGRRRRLLDQDGVRGTVIVLCTGISSVRIRRSIGDQVPSVISFRGIWRRSVANNDGWLTFRDRETALKWSPSRKLKSYSSIPFSVLAVIR